MDYLQFVNSKDIQEHLRSIGYVPNTLQAAWLVWQAQGISAEERHNAWNEIIRTMPDCEVPERPNCEYWPSLHQLLRDLMLIETDYYNRFRKSEAGAVFRYDMPLGAAWDYEMFSKFEACKSLAMEDCATDSHDNRIISKMFYIRKEWVDNRKNTDVAVFLADGRFSGFKLLSHHNLATERERDLVHSSLSGLWFEFPTPFKAGDILINPLKPDIPPVIVDGEVPLRTCVEKWGKYGDYTDMEVRGYFFPKGGDVTDVYYEGETCYMDFEYYPRT